MDPPHNGSSGLSNLVIDRRSKSLKEQNVNLTHGARLNSTIHARMKGAWYIISNKMDFSGLEYVFEY